MQDSAEATDCSHLPPHTHLYTFKPTLFHLSAEITSSGFFLQNMPNISEIYIELTEMFKGTLLPHYGYVTKKNILLTNKSVSIGKNGQRSTHLRMEQKQQYYKEAYSKHINIYIYILKKKNWGLTDLIFSEKCTKFIDDWID